MESVVYIIILYVKIQFIYPIQAQANYLVSEQIYVWDKNNCDNNMTCIY